jgi:N-acetylmuramoyl-L-alanine amidase
MQMGSDAVPEGARIGLVPAFPSPNAGPRRGGAKPSLIVIHYTGMPDCAGARARLCDPAAQVSAHWLVSEAGQAELLVDEVLRAWHAGAGEWAGIADVNSASIGIELANPGDAPFPEAQMAALERLLADVMTRHSILPQGVVAHSDMAPGRKRDPGPRFDWRRLALAGLSVWPVAGDDKADFTASARAFGYPDVPPDALLAAFRLRFRPWATGPLDAADRAAAAALARDYPASAAQTSADR